MFGMPCAYGASWGGACVAIVGPGAELCRQYFERSRPIPVGVAADSRRGEKHGWRGDARPRHRGRSLEPRRPPGLVSR